MEKYKVQIREMSKFASQEDEWIVAEFDDENTAKEFAKRWLRASLEELRKKNQNKKSLKEQWFTFGDDACVVGTDFCASKDLDFYINNPATPEEIDWKSLKDKKSQK